MIEQKDSQKILAGSLNFAAPADSIPEADALSLLNFAPTSEGALRSRSGSYVVASPAEYATRILRTGSRRYFSTSAGNLYMMLGASAPTLVASGLGSDPIGMAAANEYLYFTCQAKRGRHDGSNLYEWTPSAPPAFTVTSAGAGSLTGEYTYYAVYVTESGEEGVPSDGVSVSLAEEDATVGPIDNYTAPSGFASNVDRLRIYRSGGGQSGAFLLHEASISGAGSVTHIDSEDDATVSLRATFEAVDNDPPPAAQGLAGPYLGRFLMFNSADHPNRFWWSKLNQLHAFPGSELDEGNWADVSDAGDPVLAISHRTRLAIVYKGNEIWRVVGDPDDDSSTLERITNAHGLVGPASWCSDGTTDLFESLDGIYALNGDYARKISARLDPLFRTEQIQDVGPQDVGQCVARAQASRKMSCMAYRRGRLYFSYPAHDFGSGVDSAANSAALVCDLDTLRWFESSQYYSAICNEGPTGDLIAGNNIDLFVMEEGVNDEGAPFTLLYLGRYQDQGAPENEKTYSDLVVDCNTGGANLTVKVFTNNGATVTSLTTTLNTTTRSQVVLPIGTVDAPVLGRNIAVFVSGLTASAPVVIYGHTLHYRIEPKLARTYDSGAVDLGDRHVKTMDYFELDIHAVSDTTWKVFTDRPGAMAQRATGTVTANTGRDMVRIPFTPECEGQLIRITLSAATGFRLYAPVRVRNRPIGEYMDGANGESFVTPGLNYGM